MLTLNDGRNELWQWDTGRRLTVDAECSQVHFSNKVFGRSIDVDVVDGSAIIPDVLLQTDKDLTAWAFVGTAENGYTKISKTFKVNRRNKPADYVFSPPDQTTLGEILDRIEDLENRPSGDVSEEDIQNAVNDYLDRNPVSMDEKDPTVPAWAKQPVKPSYTAAEVGALPDTISIPSVPSALPNPHKLTLNGAVQAEYDGSEAVEVEIPSGGGGGRKPQLIRTFELAEGEEVSSIALNTCDDGTTFAEAGWRKIGVKYTTQGASDVTTYEVLFVKVNDIRPGSGYGALKQALYNARRSGYFTVEAQGCAIELSYKTASYGFWSGGQAESSTHDTIQSQTNADDKITKIQIYHNTKVMLYGTKIEIWGIE